MDTASSSTSVILENYTHANAKPLVAEWLVSVNCRRVTVATIKKVLANKKTAFLVISANAVKIFALLANQNHRKTLCGDFA